MLHLTRKLLLAAVQIQTQLLKRFHSNSLLIRKAQPVFCTDRISAAVFQPHKSQMIYLAIILRFLHIGNDRCIDLCIRIGGIFPLFCPVDINVTTILLHLQVVLDIFLRDSTVKGQQDIRRFSFASIHRDFCLGSTTISRCRSLSNRTLAYILYILYIFLRHRYFLCLRTGCISAHCGFFLALLRLFLCFCLCFTGIFLHGFFLPCAFHGRCTRSGLDRCSGKSLDRGAGSGLDRCSGKSLDRCSGRSLCGSLPISFRRSFRHDSFLLYCFLLYCFLHGS